MISKSQLKDLAEQANRIYPNIFGNLADDSHFNTLFVEFQNRWSVLEAGLTNPKTTQGCIKYFSIGEAPTSWATTYFYSQVAVNATAWFDVPLKHFYPAHAFFAARTTANKILAIDDLTRAGFVLVDVSPLPFVGPVRRNNRRYRTLIEFLYCNYFLKYVLSLFCPLLCKNARTILMGTLVFDRVINDIVTAGAPCKTNCPRLILKPAGMVAGYPRPRTTLSSACATNGPIALLFNEAAI